MSECVSNKNTCMPPGLVEQEPSCGDSTSDSSESSSTVNDSIDASKKNRDTNNDFYWSYKDEPHASRRKEILAKYPEIKTLFGHDPNMKWVALLGVSIQVVLTYHASRMSWLQYLLTAYIIGGTCNHMLMMAMHELSHNLGFRKMIHNRLFGLLANLPLGVPSFISFKRYHMEHHRFQGLDGVDVDIMTNTEASLLKSTPGKLFFMCFQILFYAVRPMLVRPKTPGRWEMFNFITCISFDLMVLKQCGPAGLFYLLLSTLLGAGLHPVAGHFISEHYVFVEGAETYSYYGILNLLVFNVGYHNEHHDFPFIPGSRLPLVRKIAAEYYDTLPSHDSWVKVIYDFITKPEVNGFSRVKRSADVMQEKKTD